MAMREWGANFIPGSNENPPNVSQNLVVLSKPGPVLGNVDRSSKRITVWDALLWCFGIVSRERFFYWYLKKKKSSL